MYDTLEAFENIRTEYFNIIDYKKELEEIEQAERTAKTELKKYNDKFINKDIKQEFINFIEFLERIRKEILKALKAAEYEREQFKNIIDLMKPGQKQRFLYDYYLRGYTFQELQKLYFYSDITSVYKLRSEAIKSLKKVAPVQPIK